MAHPPRTTQSPPIREQEPTEPGDTSLAHEHASHSQKMEHSQQALSLESAVADLMDSLGNHRTLAAARGISTAALESLYGVTRELYGQGHRAQAQRNLELLCLYDHENTRFWQALAICRKSQGDYLGAADAYARAIAHCGAMVPDLELELISCLVAAGEVEAARTRLSPLLESHVSAGEARDWQDRANALASLISRTEAAPRHASDPRA